MEATMPQRDEMERACRMRDASYDGVFFLAVRTTGIFCRPSCPARKPRPENVEYFATAEDAQRAGFRPCLRCRPLLSDGRPPEWLGGLLEEVVRDPAAPLGDGELRRRGLSPERVRRFFQKEYGMTFHAWRRGLRLAGALGTLHDGGRLDDAWLDSGYSSPSGFRDAFARAFGDAPGRGRDVEAVRVAFLPTPIGPVLAGATKRGVCLLEFADRRAIASQLSRLRRAVGAALVPGPSEHLTALQHELGDYLAGRLRMFSVPVDAPGTPFERRVWAALRRIPYGQTCSYEDLAAAVDRPGAPRAVGQANGRNRVAILIPCHRVVRKDGRLGGYGGGLWRKRFLLALERDNAPS